MAAASIAQTLALGWASRFVLQRATLLWTSWRMYAEQYEDNLKTWRQCREHAHPTAACAAAQSATQKSPLASAWEDVAAVTHLCGDRPCGEVAWATVAALLLALLVGLRVVREARAMVGEGLVPMSWKNPLRRPCPDGWCALPPS